MKRRLRTVLGILLITLILMEIGLRLTLGGAEQGGLFQFYPGDGRCVALRPNASVDFTGFLLPIPPVRMEANGLGYRGPERPQEKAPGMFRIAAVGDSYTYGFSVETDHSLPARLEQQLGVEVLNFGIPGAQLPELVAQVRHFAVRWNPDLILFFLYDNDLDEPLCTWTQFPRVFYSASAKYVYLARIPLIATVLDDSRNDHDRREQELRAGLVDMRRVSDSAGARLAVVVLGDPVNSSTRLLSILGDVPWLDARTWHAVKGHPDNVPLVPRDGHFSSEGNRIAAQRVARWARAAGLVPKREGKGP